MVSEDKVGVNAKTLVTSRQDQPLFITKKIGVPVNTFWLIFEELGTLRLFGEFVRERWAILQGSDATAAD